jgi:hypothetical protein
MEQMFEIGETVYVVDCVGCAHYFDRSSFPLKAKVLEYVKENRMGDPEVDIWNYQEYKVTDGALDQWVTYEDLISEEKYLERYNG